jgi:hypothetical protein
MFPKLRSYDLTNPSRAHMRARRDRHERRGRDAMDALGRKTCGAARTVKPCGPDAPTLAPSLVDAAMSARRWWLTSPAHQGELGVSRKAIAQGVPKCFGEPVVTTACVPTTRSAHKAAGALSARHSLRPLFREGHRRCKARTRNRAAGM